MGFDITSSAFMTHRMPNLQAVHHVAEDHVSAEGLLDSLALREGLTSLTLEGPALNLDAFRSPTTPWVSAITSLSLVNVLAIQSTFDFIDLFADSLRSLRLDFHWTNPLPSDHSDSPLRRHFPQLSSLQLRHVSNPVAVATSPPCSRSPLSRRPCLALHCRT